jgi:hypothetical protein
VASISRRQREEVMGDWRKLHTEEIRNLHPSTICMAVSNSDDEVGGLTHRGAENEGDLKER